jgi:hypothetical protein
VKRQFFYWTAIVALSSGMRCPAASLVNAGFETGDLTGWTITNIPDVTAVGQTTATTYNGVNWTVSPNGNYMAEVVGHSLSAGDLDTFFGLAPGTIENNVTPGNGPASYGDGIKQTFSGSTGDTISMAWSLVETDYEPYNDTAFVTINDASGNNIYYENLGCIVSGCTYPVGTSGSQPWTAFNYTLPSTGTYTIGFGAVNTADFDSNPYLLLDSSAGGFTAAPEPTNLGCCVVALFAIVALMRSRIRRPCSRR